MAKITKQHGSSLFREEARAGGEYVLLEPLATSRSESCGPRRTRKSKAGETLGKGIRSSLLLQDLDLGGGLVVSLLGGDANALAVLEVGNGALFAVKAVDAGVAGQCVGVFFAVGLHDELTRLGAHEGARVRLAIFFLG